MKAFRIAAIIGITLAATVAWFVLGATLSLRSQASSSRMGEEVRQVWGPGISQAHLTLVADSVTRPGDTEVMLPASSKVDAQINYVPKKRGLLWQRTYDVIFSARYEIANTSTSARNVRIQMALPGKGARHDKFIFQLGEGKSTEAAPHDGIVETVALIPAGATVPLTVGYNVRGTDRWSYTFAPGSRVKDFHLTMTTNFDDVSYPVGATSPTSQDHAAKGEGMEMAWHYEDTIDAQDIAMDMPSPLNAGPVIARITFFAPVSLFFFFGVLVVTGMLRGVNLHPMVYAFLAAGYFAFHLLLAYLGDQIPLHVAFAIATMVSLGLVSGYLHAVAGSTLSVISVIAQLSYQVLFSYSFFFDGLTGLTLTITGVATLAMLMMVTAKVNWEELFAGGSQPLLRKNAPPTPPAQPATATA